MAGKRFEVIYKEDASITTNVRILLDRETGVQYLCTWLGNGGGITPLLGPDGKPLVGEKEL